MKIFKQIINALQLKLKWVRIMIILSIITILLLFIIPPFFQEYKTIPVKELYEIDEKTDSVSARHISAPAPVESAPIEIKIINEEKEQPFDWKGIITWAIGAMNGLILVILNIKNLLKKKV